VYAVVSTGTTVLISRYDEGQDVTPTEFIERYRAYFGLDNLNSPIVTQFGEPRGNGCQLFMTNASWSDELVLTGIFVPNGVSETEARRGLAEIFRTRVANFDKAIQSAAAMLNPTTAGLF